jgi:hypothetical protein
LETPKSLWSGVSIGRRSPKGLPELLGFGARVLVCVLARQLAIREASLAFIEDVLRPDFRVLGFRLGEFLAGVVDDRR